MRARRMRRRLFSLFAFACLAFALYLITFVKEESNPQPANRTAHAATGTKVVKQVNAR